MPSLLNPKESVVIEKNLKMRKKPHKQQRKSSDDLLKTGNKKDIELTEEQLSKVKGGILKAGSRTKTKIEVF
jgi:hypothetical protein